MRRLEFTHEAGRDLREISEFIAKDSPAAAIRWLGSIRGACREVIAEFPEAGERCDELGGGLRRFPIGNYVIFYRVVGRVQILRILHGARDIEAIFGS